MTCVCPRCFGEKGLKRRIEEIRPNYPNEKCTFHPRYKGVPIEAVTEIIDPVFRNHFGIGDYFRHMDEQEGDPLHLAVAELVESVDDEIAEAIAQKLRDDEDYWPADGGDPFYDEDQNYIRYEPEEFYHSDLWRNFCESIVHAQRFFNTDAKQLIAELFDEIHFQRDQHKRAPVYEIKPGDPNSMFHRARIADHLDKQEEITKNPAEKLGPPPKRLRRAGRMNPAGVACFYGAFDLETCIAELRPAVGLTIIGATFELIRPIFVLDATLFEAPMSSMSLFSKKHMSRIQQWKFMRNFMQEIAKPVRPSDEHLDYIPTQAVAEYFLHHHEFKQNGKSAKIEGIIYRSAQYPGGRNIVLLGDAAQVKKPATTDKKKPKRSDFGDAFPESIASFMGERAQPENPGLQVVDQSLRTHRITGARYDSAAQDDYMVELDELGF